MSNEPAGFSGREICFYLCGQMSIQQNIQERFGNIDIYLFDQLAKGTYDNCKTVLDAGCGGGRNLLYFLKSGVEV